LPDSFKVPYDPGLRAGALVVRKTIQCINKYTKIALDNTAIKQYTLLIVD